MDYGLWADVIGVLHALFVLFVVGGQGLIVVGWRLFGATLPLCDKCPEGTRRIDIDVRYTPNNGHFGSSRKESANDPKRTLPNKWIVDKKGRRVTGGLSF